MIAIDAEHLKKWILARWWDNGGKDNDAPTTEEILAHIDREIMYKSWILAVPQWIPCNIDTETFPKDGENVLVIDEDGDYYVAWRSNGRWWDRNPYGEDIKDVRAWMPLPEPYKGDRMDDERTCGT